MNRAWQTEGNKGAFVVLMAEVKWTLVVAMVL